MNTPATQEQPRPIPIDPELLQGRATQPKTTRVDGESDIAAERRRRRVWHDQRKRSLPSAVLISDETLNGVPVRRYEGAAYRGTLLWLHGGGWAYGEPCFDDVLLTEFAIKADVRVVAVDYRLAPEHTHPAALTDALSVYRQLLQDSGEALLVGGASAGATIGAGMALKLRDESEALPLALILVCPPLDDRADDDDCGALRRSQMVRFWAEHLGPHAVDEYAAPARASSLVGFPRTYMYTTSADPMRLEAWRFAQRLVSAGTEVTVRFVPGGFHGFEYEAPDTRFSRRALSEWVKVIQEAVATG